MSMRDLPAFGAEVVPALRAKLEAQREVLQTLLGYRGDKLDRALTYRDITPGPDGSVVISPGGGGGTGGGTIVINPPGTSEEPDLTPPPTPTGLVVEAGLNALFIAWDVAVYTAGHGPGRTNIYGVTWPFDQLEEPTFDDAVVIGAAPHALTLYAHPTEPNTRWCIWLKFQTVDGIESATPAGGANGAQATTGQDPARLLEVLTGQITESQLYADLGARIDLIDGPASLPGSVAARVQTVQTSVTTAQEAADAAGAAAAAAASQITTVQAQVNEAAGMAPLRTWSFAADVEGWSAVGASLAHGSGVLTWTPTAANPSLGKTFTLDERFAGAQNTLVRAKVRRVSGTGAWDGNCYYTTAGHTSNNSFRKAIPEPATPGAWTVLEWDMAALTLGGSDWVDNEIRGLRIDLVGDGGTSSWEIDWIAVGAASVTPLMAAVQQETSARASGDGYLGAQWTVRMTAGNIAGGFGLSGTAAPDAQPTIDFGIRANKFYVAPPEGSSGSIANIVPFVVQTTPQVVNGVTIPAGVYMDAAYIKNLDAMVARLGNAWITSAMVGSLNAINLTAGNGTIGGNLRSSNFASGSTGWILQPNGYAEFSNVVIRGATYTGTIFAGAGTIGGFQINATDIRSSSYVANTSGLLLQSDGSAFLNNASVRGSINGGAFTGFAWPTSGTGFHLGPSGLLLGRLNSGRYFRVDADGDVTAPGFSITGGNATYSGALNAASGTFSGSLTADAVNAVDTLNLRGQAVTIPVGAFTAGAMSGDGVTQSVTLTSTGAPIKVDAGFVVNNVAVAASGSIAYRLVRFRNGSESDLLFVSVGVPTNSSASISLPPIIDQPGSGTVTYRLYVVNSNTNVTHRGITALELKK